MPSIKFDGFAASAFFLRRLLGSLLSKEDNGWLVCQINFLVKSDPPHEKRYSGYSFGCSDCCDATFSEKLCASSVDYLGAEREAAGEFDQHSRETRSRLRVTCRGESARSSQGTLQTQVNTKWKVSVIFFVPQFLFCSTETRGVLEFDSNKLFLRLKIF